VLPAAHRLRAGREIAVTARRGARAAHDDLVASALLTVGDAGPARAAVVVGRRAGGAVDRNRLRRRIRHALAPHVAGLPAGTTVVFRAGPHSHQLSAPDLSAAVKDTLTRAVRGAERRSRPPVAVSR